MTVQELAEKLFILDPDAVVLVSTNNSMEQGNAIVELTSVDTGTWEKYNLPCRDAFDGNSYIQETFVPSTQSGATKCVKLSA